MAANKDEITKIVRDALASAAETGKLDPTLLTDATTFIREHANDYDALHEAMKMLGDAAREEENRPALGESGVLVAALEAAESQLEMDELAPGQEELLFQCMRVVGNCCADNDENRQRVLDDKPSLFPVVGVIQEYNLSQNYPARLLPVAVGALNNIMQDYEPAQKAAKLNGFAAVLYRALNRNPTQVAAKSPATEMILRITDMLINDDEGINSFPSSTIHLLINLAVEPDEVDFEIFQSIVHHINCLLQNQTFVNTLLDSGNLDAVLSIMFRAYQLFPMQYEEKEPGKPKKLQPESELLQGLLTTLSERLADICAEFASLEHLDGHKLGSNFIPRLRRWIKDPPLTKKLQQVACICLGNIARSDGVCTHFVQSFNLHKDLAKILADESADIAGLYAAAGFLRNLALPHQNKVAISAEPDVWTGLRRMWRANEGLVKDVPYSAAGFVRILCVQCSESVYKLLGPADSKTSSEDYESATGLPKTNLSHMLHLYKTSDEVATKTEIARTLIGVLRVLAHEESASTSQSAIGSNLQKAEIALFNVDSKWDYHDVFPVPIIDLIHLDKWDVVRSEAWFALGLLARIGCDRGAHILWTHRDKWFSKVQEVLDTFPAAHALATRVDDIAMTGTDSPPGGPTTKPKDVSNIAVFLLEMSKRLEKLELDDAENRKLHELVDKALTISTVLQTVDSTD